jgi:hypothetical protein
MVMLVSSLIGGCGDEPPAEPVSEDSAPIKARAWSGRADTECNHNGSRDHHESDVDCGGGSSSGCPACVAGKHCETGSDCKSGECSRNVCMKSTGAECAADGECGSGICAISCASSNNWAVRTCVAPCTRASDCEGDSTCTWLHDADGSPTRPVCVSGSRTASGSYPSHCAGWATMPVPLTIMSSSPYPGYGVSYVSGGTTWYQDFYSQKWCTGSQVQVIAWGYEHNGCTWSGYYPGSQEVTGSCYYCSNGVEQACQVHNHCP